MADFLGESDSVVLYVAEGVAAVVAHRVGDRGDLLA
jgi:hypothetical protein